VRKLLDKTGFNNATITVSNELDEFIIETLVNSGAPVDIWGVGTQMVTGGNDPALTGVYKMAACEDANGQMTPVMKFSDNPEKTTNPGIKQVWRIKDSNGSAIADVLALNVPDEAEFLPGSGHYFWHPSADYRRFYHVIDGEVQALLKKYLANGEYCRQQPSLTEMRSSSAAGLEMFDNTYKRLLNPHVYKVSITEKLRSMKLEFIKNHL
jgi:nicotinate phosphoribosyltransferase